MNIVNVAMPQNHCVKQNTNGVPSQQLNCLCSCTQEQLSEALGSFLSEVSFIVLSGSVG